VAARSTATATNHVFTRIVVIERETPAAPRGLLGFLDARYAPN
jgi:hypothetical protein